MTRNDTTQPTQHIDPRVDLDAHIHEAFNKLHRLLLMRDRPMHHVSILNVARAVDSLHHDFTDATMHLEELTD